MKVNVCMKELEGEERKRVIAEFERYESEKESFANKIGILAKEGADDQIKGSLEEHYSSWVEQKGITLLLEDIQVVLSKQDEDIKPVLLPIWNEFVKEKIEIFPIVETCTVINGLTQRLMLLKLGDIEDYIVAKRIIQAYFESERGAECLNDMVIKALRKDESLIKRFINTTDETHLYPLLHREALIQMEKGKLSYERKERIRGHLKQFMDDWEKEAKAKPQQAGKSNPKTKQDILTDRAKKYFQRAIGAGYMEETETGYRWSNGKKVQLAYFVNKVYNPKGCTAIPQKALEGLFNVRRLDSALSQSCSPWKKQTPRWVREMDETLFYD